jgi:hypothetical protein
MHPECFTKRQRELGVTTQPEPFIPAAAPRAIAARTGNRAANHRNQPQVPRNQPIAARNLAINARNQPANRQNIPSNIRVQAAGNRATSNTAVNIPIPAPRAANTAAQAANTAASAVLRPPNNAPNISAQIAARNNAYVQPRVEIRDTVPRPARTSRTAALFQTAAALVTGPRRSSRQHKPRRDEAYVYY